MTGIERLRELASKHRIIERYLTADTIDSIADQIERERICDTDTIENLRLELHDALKTDTTGTADAQSPSWRDPACAADVSFGASKVTRDPAEDVSMSAYDLLPQEERDVIAWVREHGGLDAARRELKNLRGTIEETCARAGVEHTGETVRDAQAIWRKLDWYKARLGESVPRVAYERHLARRQRQIDESHAALRRKSERIGFLVSELNRAHNENHEEFMRRAGDYTAFADEVCKRLAPEKRYMEGCSKDVMDEALSALDRRLMPEGMEWPMVDGEPVDFKTGYEPSLGVLEAVSIYSNGACEVMSHDGIVESAKDIHIAKPKVLDADGAEIREKLDAWWICEGDERGVHAERLRVETIKPDGLVECSPYNGGTNVELEPSELYVNMPTIASDGRPLCEGEEVWSKGGCMYVVEDVADPDSVRCRSASVPTSHITAPASCFTHERPEIDSWERLEEDATLPPETYCVKREIDFSDVDGQHRVLDEVTERMARDLVRRARALAGGA